MPQKPSSRGVRESQRTSLRTRGWCGRVNSNRIEVKITLKSQPDAQVECDYSRAEVPATADRSPLSVSNHSSTLQLSLDHLFNKIILYKHKPCRWQTYASMCAQLPFIRDAVNIWDYITILHESGALSCALEKTCMRQKDKNLVENMWQKYVAPLD